MRQSGLNLRGADPISAAIALQRFDRSANGADVVYLGGTYRVTTAVVSEGVAGLSFLSRQKLAAYSAAADPRVFNFSADDFAGFPADSSQIVIKESASGDENAVALKTISLADTVRGGEAELATGIRAPVPPLEGSIVTWHGRDYFISHVGFDDVGGKIVAYLAYGYRVLMEVFPIAPFTLWLPKTMAQLTNPNTGNVKDASYRNGGSIEAFLVPMEETELMTITGALDVRTNRAITDVAVPQKAVLINQATNEAWEAISPSETFPAPVLLATPLRHLVKIPQGVILAITDEAAGLESADVQSGAGSNPSRVDSEEPDLPFADHPDLPG